MLTHDQLKKAIHYDPASGEFTWTRDRRYGRNKAFLVAKAGTPAGFKGGYGYLYIVIETHRNAEFTKKERYDSSMPDMCHAKH